MDYLPDFDAEKIEEAIAARWRSIWHLLCWAMVTIVLTVVFTLFAGRIAWYVGAAVCGLGALPILQQLREIVLLAARLRAVKLAPVVEPDPTLSETQPTNWWSLLKAGFSSKEYDDPFDDASLGLVGRPWRVLYRGSQRIPVFRKIAGEPKLGHQHFIRMAAYCRLVVQAEGGEAPYSVVLFGRGYDGVSVPNLDKHQRELPQTVEALRAMLFLVAHRRMVPDVPNGNVCRGCQFGLPEESSETSTTTGRRIKRTRGKNGRLYRSDCGDRFDWVPPHELAEKLGLRAQE